MAFKSDGDILKFVVVNLNFISYFPSVVQKHTVLEHVKRKIFFLN